MKTKDIKKFHFRSIFFAVFFLTSSIWLLNPGYGSNNFIDSSTKEENSIIVSISIDNDTDFSLQAGNHGWTGNGTQSNPFIIKDLFFNDSLSNQPLISIQNTKSFFKLENISLLGGSYGILLTNVTNALIINCSIGYTGEEPIYLYETENIAIKNSHIFNSGQISFNILIDYSSNILIENNTISNSNFDGIKFRGSGSSQIINNTVQNSKSNGIVFGGTQNMSIIDNIIKENGGYGVSVESNIINLDFIHNLIYNNAESGASVYAQNSSIMKNTFYNNSFYGLAIAKDSLNSSIIENNFIANDEKNPGPYQISDVTNSSQYRSNYYSDYTGPDVDNDGIVDTPFQIIENGPFFDQYPKTTAYLTPRIHILTKPNIYSLFEKREFSGTLTIAWGKSSDTFNHSISYTLYISNDNKTWNELAENINSTSFLLDTTKLTDYKDYYIKIVATDSVIFSNFEFADSYFRVNNQPPSDNSTSTTSNTSGESQSNSKASNDAFTFFLTLSCLSIMSLFIIRNRPKK